MEIHKAIIRLCSLCEQVGRCSECIDMMYGLNKQGETHYTEKQIYDKEIEFHEIVHECDELRIEIEEACPNVIILKREINDKAG